ncbi:MAG: DUF6089 family protein [Bacteroidota bacterium]|nr:DUF6089 family protein [Bacteroidota bacterium]
MNIIIFATYFNQKVRSFLLILLGVLLSTTTLSAQIYELGIFAGGSNAVGDVGKEDYIAPNSLAIGGVFRYNRSPRHSWRLSVLTSNLKIDDTQSATSRKERGYVLENAVTEFTAALEFNFFDFNLHSLDTKITPYVFTGLSYFRYESKYFKDAKEQLDKKNGSFAIPMVVGVKAKLNRSFVLGVEVGARYTFVDDLDGSNPKSGEYQQYKFGNLSSKDWYVFTGITLTYMFGEQPCYCSF